MRITSIATFTTPAVALLMGVIGAGSPAAAAGPAPEAITATPAGRAARTPLNCEVTPAPGQGTINVRSGPRTSSEIRDYLQPGEFMPSQCSGVSGGSYTACGGTSTSWIEVYSSGLFSGYVARRCVTLYRWS